MSLTASMVKELREKSGAGMMDCKKALSENNGQMQDAIDWLRKKGLASVSKKSARFLLATDFEKAPSSSIPWAKRACTSPKVHSRL